MPSVRGGWAVIRRVQHGTPGSARACRNETLQLDHWTWDLDPQPGSFLQLFTASQSPTDPQLIRVSFHPL